MAGFAARRALSARSVFVRSGFPTLGFRSPNQLRQGHLLPNLEVAKSVGRAWNRKVFAQDDGTYRVRSPWSIRLMIIFFDSTPFYRRFDITRLAAKVDPDPEREPGPDDVPDGQGCNRLEKDLADLIERTDLQYGGYLDAQPSVEEVLREIGAERRRWEGPEGARAELVGVQ